MNSAISSDGHHKVLIVGGRSAGLTLAARLRRSGLPDVAVLERTPSLPFIDTLKPRRDMYLLKRYGLPALYWLGMLKGRA